MKILNLLKITGIICFLFGLLSCSQNSDWREWRGPNRDGKVVGFKSLETWPAKLKQVWRKPVGLCNSSPVVAENQLYLHVKQENNEVAICLDEKTGETIWSTILNPAPEVTGGARNHPGPRSTPTIANGNVYLLGAGGIVSCVDAKSGKIVWQNKNYTEVPQFFTSMSPLVVDGKCFVHLGGHDNGTIVAFNTKDGGIAWEIKGEPCTYASPVIMNFDKKQFIVFQTETDLLGINLEGEELWKIPTPGERRFYNSSTPVVDGQNLIIAGQGLGTKSYKIEKSGNDYSFTENWNNPDVGVSFNTPVLKDGFLYGNDASFGKVFCINAASGKTCWTDTTKHNRFASTLDLGEIMLSMPATGELLIFSPDSEKYSERAAYKIAETEVYAHPLVIGNKIFIKDEESLTCWSLE